MRIKNGKTVIRKRSNSSINEKIKANVAELEAKGVKPTLGIIRVGEREDDLSYERGATKRCETLGVAYEKFLLPADVTQEELMATIDKVNKDRFHPRRSDFPSASETSR